MMPLDDTHRQRDAELLAAYAAGDADAARQLINDHAPRARNLALRMLGNAAEAEEVAQEALLRLWKQAPNWRAGEARISTWLYRVTSNLCTDRLRRVRPGPLPDGFDPPDGRPGQDAVLHQQQRLASLEAEIARLPERQRLAIVLRHLEERGNPEIAEVMGLSVEAVESLLARGRRQLAARLGGQRAELSYKDSQDD